MMRRYRRLILAAIVFCSSVMLAQSRPVTVSPIAPVRVARGKSATVTVEVHIPAGMHINSHEVTSELLRPTELKLQPPTELMTGYVQYPAGEDYISPAMPDEKLNVYSGTVRLQAMVRAMNNASTGTFRIHGELRYQACSDRQCLPPRSVPIQFDVHVTR